MISAMPCKLVIAAAATRFVRRLLVLQESRHKALTEESRSSLSVRRVPSSHSTEANLKIFPLSVLQRVVMVRLGPIACSDGSSLGSWGVGCPGPCEPFSVQSAANPQDGCGSLYVAWGADGLTYLNSEACGGTLAGAPSLALAADLVCPAGMKVVGVHGTYTTNVLSLGVFCR